METKRATRGGFPIVGLLGVLFVGLKLTDYIDWPWIWVLSPFWIPFAAVMTIFVVMVTVSLAMKGSK